LPRVEKELKNLLQSYEQNEGKLFLFKDERLLDVIDRQWNENKSNKKNLQQTKVFSLFLLITKSFYNVLIYFLYLNYEMSSPKYKLAFKAEFKHLKQPLVIKESWPLHLATKLLRSVKLAWTIKLW